MKVRVPGNPSESIVNVVILIGIVFGWSDAGRRVVEMDCRRQPRRGELGSWIFVTEVFGARFLGEIVYEW